MKLPESWREVRLGDILHRVEAKVDPQRAIDLTHFYVGLEHIESHTGRLLREAEDVTDSTDILSIKTAFQKGDLLYGKLRPNLNKVHLAGQDGICSTDIWALRASDELNPEFGLHFLRSPAIHVRASQLAAGANLPRVSAESFDRISFPLPSLPEQRRIVNVLRQAEALYSSRKASEETIQELTREYFTLLFGNVVGNEKGWASRKLGLVSEIVRGSSPRPQGDPRLFGGPVPRLMVSDLTRDGLWVDATTDSLTEEGAKASRPMPAQSVVVAVSGAPGLTAILNHDACIHDGFVGLRDLNAELLPEFVAFTLNLLRAKNDQQAVGAVFRNLTTDQIKTISIPVPPIELQKQFRSFLMQVKAVQQDIVKSKRLLDELSRTLAVDAFSGELTTNWREVNQDKITTAATSRDVLLRERGAKLASRPSKTAISEPAVKVAPRSTRQWLLAELSEFQRQVFNALLVYEKQPLFTEDPDRFAAFCTDERLTQSLSDFSYSSNKIGRTISLLADLGLIAQISLPSTNSLTQAREYLKAFRALRVDEYTKMADVETLRRALSSGDAEVRHYFTMVLDYETSEHAGAGGMFQVEALSDEDDKDRTDLVDQSKHYAALDELASDIARRLGVRADQIELEE